MSHRNINLKTIRIDGGTQSRVALDQDAVADYRQVLADGGEFLPVTVFHDGTDNWLADGFHRFHAYLQEDRASIPADVRVGTQRDAILFACGSNSKHGLRRSNADKRKAISILLADPEWSALSDRSIAKHCDVSNTLVSNMRNPPPPVNIDTPKAPPPTSGPSAPAGGKPTAPPKPPAVPPAPPPVGKTEAEQIAEDAHGDVDLATLIDEAQEQIKELQAVVAAAEADDAKAEAMKWRHLAQVAQRRQDELQQSVNKRETDLKRYMGWLTRIGKAVGEEDPSKVPATVEAFVRSMKAPA